MNGWIRRLKVTIKALAALRPGSVSAIRELRRFSLPELETLQRVLERAEDAPEVVKQFGDYADQSRDVCVQYHRWYVDTEIWMTTTFLGHHTLKAVGDLWNYQEILFELRPGLVVEFGAFAGGGTLFFSKMLQLVRPDSKVLSVDITLERVPGVIREERHIEFMEASSVEARVFQRIRELRQEYPGPMFVILDSDHAKEHVLAELRGLRNVTARGDYVVVEDTHFNGHPVVPSWGAGPYEALQEYHEAYPDDYEVDAARERKFGFSFATEGFLVRR